MERRRKSDFDCVTFVWIDLVTDTRDKELLPRFFQGGGAKSTVMQISTVMLIFLLFSDKSLGPQKSLSGAPAPCG